MAVNPTNKEFIWGYEAGLKKAGQPVAINAGQIAYDDSASYTDGTVGGELNKMNECCEEVTADVNTLKSEIDEELLDHITHYVSANLLDPSTRVVGRLEKNENNEVYVDTTVTTSYSCGYIPVKPGDAVQMFRNNSGTAARIYRSRLATFDASKNLVLYSETSTNSAYTVPDGVYFVRFSWATYLPMIAVNYTNGDPFVPYFAPYDEYNTDFITPQTRELIYGQPMNGKVIVNMGDSIFGNFRSTVKGDASESISNIVALMTGATVHNCAFGGTHAKTMGGTARAPMDFQSLVTAIISGVWTDQEAYATEQSESYLARVQALEAIDFTEVDVVTVSYGTNDFSSQVTPDQYEAALTDGITRLQTAFPNLLCVICTPMIRFKHADDPDSDPEDNNGVGEGTDDIVSSDTYTSSSGYKLTEYAAKVEDVGKAMHCPVCENYWTLGINLYNYSTFMGGMAAADLVHPNAKGRRLIANHLADTLVRL